MKEKDNTLSAMLKDLLLKQALLRLKPESQQYSAPLCNKMQKTFLWDSIVTLALYSCAVFCLINHLKVMTFYTKINLNKMSY